MILALDPGPAGTGYCQFKKGIGETGVMANADMLEYVKRDGSKPELYDITKDPNEENDLAVRRSDLAERYANEVIKWYEDTTPNP